MEDTGEHEFAYLLNYETQWSQIKALLRDPEVDQMHKIIGAELIDGNVVLAGELDSLVTILIEYRRGNDDLAGKTHQRLKALPAPPQRELLQGKVRGLLTKFAHDGYWPEPATPRERDVLAFVVDSSTPRRHDPHGGAATAWDRPTTPHSSSFSMRSMGRPDSACSSRSGLSIASCSQKLNVIDVDEVLEELRDALREEHDVLLNNCEYLRELLEEEMSYNARTSSFRVPTVRELSDLAAKLEEEDQQLAHEMKVNSLPDVGPRSGSVFSTGSLSVRSFTSSLSSATPPPYAPVSPPPLCIPSGTPPLRLGSQSPLRNSSRTPPTPLGPPRGTPPFSGPGVGTPPAAAPPAHGPGTTHPRTPPKRGASGTPPLTLPDTWDLGFDDDDQPPSLQGQDQGTSPGPVHKTPHAPSQMSPARNSFRNRM